MAQFSFTPSLADVGTLPSGLVNIGTTDGGRFIVADSGGTAVLRGAGATASRRGGFAFLAPGSVSDGEVYVRFVATSALVSRAGPIARLPQADVDAAAYTRGYYVRADTTAAIAADGYKTTSQTTAAKIATLTNAIGTTGTVLHALVKCVGTEISYKCWSDGGSEPAYVTVTDIDHTAGYFGFTTQTSCNIDVLYIGAGTGTDPAPRGTADTIAPTLTSPTASATGATTASGSVSTNEGNGTLYWFASGNASESVATVKAGSSQAVSASGVQNVTVTGLAASTSYYLHFVHTDAAANDSTVAASAQFTTSAAGDTSPPTLTGPTGTATGATTASGTISTNEDTGTLYWLASTNASETGTTVKAGSAQAVSAVGTQNVTVSGLTASTAYYLHYLHRDAAGNDSTVATSAQFTTSAAPDTTVPTLTGSVTFASITQTTYTASWPAGSDNVAVTGYEYQIGSSAGTWTDAGNNLSVAITGRTAGTTETVYVRAYDAAGNRSTPAISGEVTLASALPVSVRLQLSIKTERGGYYQATGWRYTVFADNTQASIVSSGMTNTDATGVAIIDVIDSPFAVGDYVPLLMTQSTTEPSPADRTIRTMYGFVPAVAIP